MAINHDFAHWIALQRALEPLRAGHQANLHKDAGKRQLMRGLRCPLLVAKGRHTLAVAHDFGDLRILDHTHVGQALQFFLQHGIGLEFGHEFQQRDVLGDAGQINSRLHARIAAANHGHRFALEQRPVAMRAEGHAARFVVRFTGYAHFAPARASGHNDGACLEYGAV